jgi:hypothetical protein
MSRPTGEKTDYRGWRCWVIVVPAPDDRWTFVVYFEHGNDPKRIRRANATYTTMQEADLRGDRYARDWIDEWGEIL